MRLRSHLPFGRPNIRLAFRWFRSLSSIYGIMVKLLKMRHCELHAGLIGLLWFCIVVPLQTGAGTPNGDGNRQGDLSAASRTVLGITLGRSNLAKVQEKLGRAKLWSSGDASTSEHKVCYVTRGARQVVLVFASNSEMAGPPENDVTNIRIVKGAAYPDRSKCGSLTISGNEVSTNSGLKLGLTQAGVRRILGPPRKIAGSTWDYSWSVDLPLSTSDKNRFFMVSSWLTIQFYRGRVIRWSLGRIESMP